MRIIFEVKDKRFIEPNRNIFMKRIHFRCQKLLNFASLFCPLNPLYRHCSQRMDYASKLETVHIDYSLHNNLWNRSQKQSENAFRSLISSPLPSHWCFPPQNQDCWCWRRHLPNRHAVDFQEKYGGCDHQLLQDEVYRHMILFLNISFSQKIHFGGLS